MKTWKYMALLLGVLPLMNACSEDGLDNQNQNKPRPTVTLTPGSMSASSFTFTITASENSTQYGFAIFIGADNEIPSAYDIVSDKVSGAALTGVFNTADTETQQLKINASMGQYQIFGAAITATGLLSEVTVLDMVPGGGGGSTQLVEGIYKVTYTNPSELSGGQITPMNPNSGQPFTLYFIDEGQGMYALFNYWFDQLYAFPILVGMVDDASGRLVFPDQQVNPDNGEVMDGVYGWATYYYDEAHTQVMVFWGSGDTGTEPIQALFDAEGKLTQISYFEYDVYDDKSKEMVGVFDICADGKMEYQGPLPEPDKQMMRSRRTLRMLTSDYIPATDRVRFEKR